MTTTRKKGLVKFASILVVLGMMFNMTNYQSGVVYAEGGKTQVSFESATYRDETIGFEFDYPSTWIASDSMALQGGETQVQFAAPDGITTSLIVHRWEPVNDLDAYIRYRTEAWLAGGMTILSQDPMTLAGDHFGGRFMVQTTASEQTFFFFTSFGDRYLEMNSLGDSAVLTEIASTVRAIETTVLPTETPVAPTEPPVAPTNTPVAPTNAPAAPTNAPVLPTLESNLSADGLSMYNGVAPLVVVVDNNPAMQGIQIPAEPEVAAAISAAVTDPSAVNAAFSITYKAAGTTDPWGATCQTFPTAARTAFNAAAAIWTATLQSSVPVTISACWSNLGSSTTLGYSGDQPLRRNFTGAPKANTWYQGSLANALHGSDLDPSVPDMHITHNSGFSWYYGTDGHPPAGTYDLVTVAAHEMAHGLNFSGSAVYSGGYGGYGYGLSNPNPNIYDTFMENSAGTKLTALTNPSTALGSLLTSNSLWFNGAYARAANGGTRLKMYAPSSWASGSSYSHLDYSTFAGTTNNMMVYAVSSASAQHNPGAVTKGLLKDLGWVLTSITPTVPTPVAPSGTISDTTPTFTWTRISGATNYYLAVYNGTTTLAYVNTVASTACGASTTTCSLTPTNVLSIGAHSWKVMAYVGGAWEALSAFKPFTVTNVPTPIAPSGTVSDTTPTFTWTRISRATNYYLAVYQGTTLKYVKGLGSSACGTSTTTCSLTPTNVLSIGAHSWKVMAYVGGAWKAFSALKPFTVTNIPTPILPSGTTTDTTPTFTWTRISGATNYHLAVYRGTTLRYSKAVASTACGASTTTCSYTPTNVLTAGAYSWRGMAYVGGAWEPFGALKPFTVTTSTAFNDLFMSSSAG